MYNMSMSQTTKTKTATQHENAHVNKLVSFSLDGFEYLGIVDYYTQMLFVKRMLQLTMLNLYPSEYNFIVQIKCSDELKSSF